jgi:CoA:oxalate CoA-transferase
VRRGITGQGGLVEISLLESILDLQFEVFTTHLNDGHRPPRRSAVNNGHAYLGAPYGIYATRDGFLALAMGNILRLGQLLGLPALAAYTAPATWFTARDEIKAHLVAHLATQTTAHWLALLEPADYWCAEILSWEKLRASPAFQVLDFEQTVTRDDGPSLRTTRCPIMIDGQRYTSPRGAPRVGQHTDTINATYQLAEPSRI